MLQVSVFFANLCYIVFIMLTTKQSQVLSFIEEYNEENGISPTLKEIAKFLNVSTASTAHQHVKELLNKGFLRQADDYGAVEIVTKTNASRKIPVLGTIAAGSPILAIEEELADTVSAEGLPEIQDFFALRVMGESMIEDGIYDGDIVVIKKQNTALDGQTVVAIVDKENATLKKIYKDRKGYRLQPANQAMLPIFTQDVEIRGIVWEIRRSFNNSTEAKTGKKTWRTLDLFAGIGGIRLGFEKLGFKTAFANDFEAACKITYDLNFEESKLVVEDITKIKAKDIPEFDLLLGGFPCQAFSVAGYRHGFDDQKGRGNLFFEIARIIDDRKPEGFLLENVKNLKNHDNGNTFKVIEQTLNKLGYKIKSKVLNSMEYGNVPQNRERIYVVGFKDPKKTEAFEFPDPLPLTNKISNVLEKNVEEKYYYDGKPLYEKLKNVVNEAGQVYQWRRQYVRQNKKGVCPTLTANMGMGGHNVPIIYDGKGIRKLTPRECARIQGFPDSYKLPENLPDSKLYKQIGNSVSVPVIERIAKQMAEVL